MKEGFKMYKLISVEEYDITRHVTLKNTETGTEDYCFDDSDMVDIGHKDFWFMEVGKKYDCKIQLFGRIVSDVDRNKNAVLCKIVRDNVIVGKARLVEVAAGSDRYYIPHHDVVGRVKDEYFYFDCIRKDLIQVSNVIHGDYLD